MMQVWIKHWPVMLAQGITQLELPTMTWRDNVKRGRKFMFWLKIMAEFQHKWEQIKGQQNI